MGHVIPTALIYLLGLIGAGAVGILPVRVMRILRDLRSVRGSMLRKASAVAAKLAIATAALLVEAQILRQLFGCLTGAYCGPGVASGWSSLAALGATYLVFEVLVLLLQLVYREGAQQVAPGE